MIADRVARFGVAAVGAGAAGMACGTRVYRVLADARLEHQYTRSAKPATGFPVVVTASCWPRPGSATCADRFPRARTPDCDVLAGNPTSDQVRSHAIHLVQDELAAAQQDPAALAAGWSTSPRNYVRAWGQALEQALRRSQEA